MRSLIERIRLRHRTPAHHVVELKLDARLELVREGDEQILLPAAISDAGNQDPGSARRPARRFHKIVNGADVSGPAGIAIRKRDPSETTAQSPCERGI